MKNTSAVNNTCDTQNILKPAHVKLELHKRTYNSKMRYTKEDYLSLPDLAVNDLDQNLLSSSSRI